MSSHLNLNHRLKNLLLVVVVLLMGCSKGEPVKITDSQRQYIGAWQYLHEAETKSTLAIHNVLLEIRPDATALYRKCVVTRSAAKGNYVSSRYNKTSKITYPSAIVTGLTDKAVSLEQELGYLHLKQELEINKVPYTKQGRRYLEIDGVRLKKLEGREIDQLTRWQCPDDDEHKDDTR